MIVSLSLCTSWIQSPQIIVDARLSSLFSDILPNVGQSYMPFLNSIRMQRVLHIMQSFTCRPIHEQELSWEYPMKRQCNQSKYLHCSSHIFLPASCLCTLKTIWSRSSNISDNWTVLVSSSLLKQQLQPPARVVSNTSWMLRCLRLVSSLQGVTSPHKYLHTAFADAYCTFLSHQTLYNSCSTCIQTGQPYNRPLNCTRN